MDRDLQAKIEAAFDDLINARKRLLEVKEMMIDAKEALKDQEKVLILEGLIGKNETERQAYMRDLTYHHRDALLNAERSERLATLALEVSLDARRNLESILRIEELEAV